MCNEKVPGSSPGRGAPIYNATEMWYGLVRPIYQGGLVMKAVNRTGAICLFLVGIFILFFFDSSNTVMMWFAGIVILFSIIVGIANEIIEPYKNCHANP